MEKSAYTAAPTLTPTTWSNRVRASAPVREELPPQPRDLKLKSARQAKGFFATIPMRLRQTFEFMRDHPGQFLLSTVTSVVTFSILRGAVALALGFTPCLAAAIATAMIASALVSIGREVVDHVYSPPPDPLDLQDAKKVSFKSVMSKALTNALWSGVFAGISGALIGEWLHNFEVAVKPMDGSGAHYDPAINGPHGTGFIDSHGYLPPSPLAYDGKAPYVWPVDPESTTTIYDNCGERIGRTAPHNGIDISVPTGTPVRAAAAGIVTEAGWHNGYGYTVTIQHTYDNPATPEIERIPFAHTRYAHLSDYSVCEGMQVEQNQFIARSGNTGNSEGPHLHFEVRDENMKVFNPLQFLPRLDELRPDGKTSYIVQGERLGKRLFDILIPVRGR